VKVNKECQIIRPGLYTDKENVQYEILSVGFDEVVIKTTSENVTTKTLYWCLKNLAEIKDELP
jgi:hypothetical protein